MITGNGFAHKFSEYGYDQDVLTEYFSTLSCIHGIETTETDNALIFSFHVDNELHPLFTFTDGECFVSELPDCPASEELLLDISPIDGKLPVPESTVDFDETILAIYRFIHAI